MNSRLLERTVNYFSYKGCSLKDSSSPAFPLLPCCYMIHEWVTAIVWCNSDVNVWGSREQAGEKSIGEWCYNFPFRREGLVKRGIYAYCCTAGKPWSFQFRNMDLTLVSHQCGSSTEISPEPFSFSGPFKNQQVVQLAKICMCFYIRACGLSAA